MKLSEQPIWNILDSSKLDDFLRCRRRYFYSHILGWRPSAPAHDLHFGTCWHLAREHQLIHGYEDIEGAYSEFLTEYRKIFDESTDDMFIPKTPKGVWEALMAFTVHYMRDLEDNELLRNPDTNEPFTEIAGTVPISDSKMLHFRMDSILRRKSNNKVFSWDHKTTSANYIKYPPWEEQFYLSIQNGTYTHCLYCIFPAEEVLGVEFCGTGFGHLKRGSTARPAGYHQEFKRVSAFRTPSQMNVWLWTVIDLVNEVEMETDRLTHCSDSDSVLQAFPLNPGGCSKYKGCEFHDYCTCWENPLQQCGEPPLGFIVEFWNPADKDSRNKMELEWR